MATRQKSTWCEQQSLCPSRSDFKRYDNCIERGVETSAVGRPTRAVLHRLVEMRNNAICLVKQACDMLCLNSVTLVIRTSHHSGLDATILGIKRSQPYWRPCCPLE